MVNYSHQDQTIAYYSSHLTDKNKYLPIQVTTMYSADNPSGKFSDTTENASTGDQTLQVAVQGPQQMSYARRYEIGRAHV